MKTLSYIVSALLLLNACTSGRQTASSSADGIYYTPGKENTYTSPTKTAIQAEAQQLNEKTKVVVSSRMTNRDKKSSIPVDTLRFTAETRTIDIDAEDGATYYVMDEEDSYERRIRMFEDGQDYTPPTVVINYNSNYGYAPYRYSAWAVPSPWWHAYYWDDPFWSWTWSPSWSFYNSYGYFPHHYYSWYWHYPAHYYPGYRPPYHHAHHGYYGPHDTAARPASNNNRPSGSNSRPQPINVNDSRRRSALQQVGGANPAQSTQASSGSRRRPVGSDVGSTVVLPGNTGNNAQGTINNSRRRATTTTGSQQQYTRPDNSRRNNAGISGSPNNSRPVATYNDNSTRNINREANYNNNSQSRSDYSRRSNTNTNTYNNSSRTTTNTNSNVNTSTNRPSSGSSTNAGSSRGGSAGGSRRR
jgi:hypothetical protein